jgi:hypothetical protein
MIEAIYVLGIAAAILVNITALTLLVLRYIPFPAIARATGIICVCLVLFSVEHFVGLGRLSPLCLPLTALSLFVIWSGKIHDEFPRDTGIYGSFAQKPNLVGLPYALLVWKRDLPELPALVAQIKSFYGGTNAQAERFLTDHDVRYVVWSYRDARDLARWQAIDADYRWMEFSPTPEVHIGLWIRR